MVPFNLLSEEFSQAVSAAWMQARRNALDSGHPVVFEDDAGRYVLEQPDGKKFEIRFRPGEPRDSHFEVVRELPAA